MFTTSKPLGLAFAIAAMALVSAPLEAGALPLNAAGDPSPGLLTLAQYSSDYGGGNMHMNGPGRHWSRARDGGRCRYAYGRCRHFYRGYYYETPWWTLPLIVGGAVGRHYGSYHVRWCMNRYRSYDPRTDTYMGSDGQRHLCRG